MARHKDSTLEVVDLGAEYFGWLGLWKRVSKSSVKFLVVVQPHLCCAILMSIFLPIPISIKNGKRLGFPLEIRARSL